MLGHGDNSADFISQSSPFEGVKCVYNLRGIAVHYATSCFYIEGEDAQSVSVAVIQHQGY